MKYVLKIIQILYHFIWRLNDKKSRQLIFSLFSNIQTKHTIYSMFSYYLWRSKSAITLTKGLPHKMLIVLDKAINYIYIFG